MTDYERRVARGAVELDLAVPGWWDRIEVGRLNIGRCDNCICGQLVGNYAVTVDRPSSREGAMARRLFPEWGSLQWRSDHGFADGLNSKTNFRALTAAWKAEILHRRAGAAVVESPEPSAELVGVGS
jgi:hypothetical protein